MKIYISGKVTGEPNAAKLFQEAEIELATQGHEPVNPMRLPHNHDKTWESYMREDIKILMDCDGIYMLENWEESKGASLEQHLSYMLKMKILYQ